MGGVRRSSAVFAQARVLRVCLERFGCEGPELIRVVRTCAANLSMCPGCFFVFAIFVSSAWNRFLSFCCRCC